MENKENNLYIELNESLKLVFDITSRIDERTKVLIESNHESKARIEKLYNGQSELINRITILENKNNFQIINDIKNEISIIENKVEHLSERCLHLEKDMTQTTNKWSTMIDFFFKISTVVVGGLILWKLGIKP